MKTVAKTRILVTRFPYQSQLGGEELHSLELMEALDQKGISSVFLGSCPVLLREFKARHFETQKAWLAKPPVTKMWLILFTLLSPFLFLRARAILKRAVRRWEVNTVYMHSLGEKLLMTPWALKWGMKVVWVEHARIGRWLTQNPWRKWYQHLAGRVTVVVTSHAMAKILRPLVPKVVAISCAAWLQKSEPLPSDLSDFIDSGFSVACVARLTADKGVDMLVHAVHSKPEMRLVLVGQGPLKGALEKAAENAPVRLLPSLPRGQIMELLKSVDLVVLPSREMDPFGMVAAEAMMLGTPVLVTSSCGIAADLRSGEQALIVEPTFRELDKGLKRLIKDKELRQYLGETGKRFAQKYYGEERMVEAFERILT